jgi:hypothetical protein
MGTTEDNATRPFHINIPEAVLADLRRRLGETRLPEEETVADHSQGVPLKTVQQVLRYWQSDYDWRKVEARLNAVPNFITEIGDRRLGSRSLALATQHLKKGDKIRLTGLGILQVRARTARMGRNPATGASIKIAASKRSPSDRRRN